MCKCGGKCPSSVDTENVEINDTKINVSNTSGETSTEDLKNIGAVLGCALYFALDDRTGFMIEHGGKQFIVYRDGEQVQIELYGGTQKFGHGASIRLHTPEELDTIANEK